MYEIYLKLIQAKAATAELKRILDNELLKKRLRAMYKKKINTNN